MTECYFNSQLIMNGCRSTKLDKLSDYFCINILVEERMYKSQTSLKPSTVTGFALNSKARDLSVKYEIQLHILQSR